MTTEFLWNSKRILIRIIWLLLVSPNLFCCCWIPVISKRNITEIGRVWGRARGRLHTGLFIIYDTKLNAWGLVSFYATMFIFGLCQYETNHISYHFFHWVKMKIVVFIGQILKMHFLGFTKKVHLQVFVCLRMLSNPYLLFIICFRNTMFGTWKQGSL